MKAYSFYLKSSPLIIPALLFIIYMWPQTAHAHDGHRHAPATEITSRAVDLSTQWNGIRAAYLGDSMTDPKNKSANTRYWAYLEKLSGIEPHVFARSGYRWDGIYKKAVEMNEALGDSVDVIFIWAGTNDYNHNVPLGEFYTESVDRVNYNGETVARKHREFIMNDTTFTGNINRVMSYLKHNYPDRQIIIMTPIHRGYATFNEHNVQPDENYANGLGLYIEDYVAVLRRAADLWSVPVIDLFSESGLFPMEKNHSRYFHHGDTDLLHPNDTGHYRIARTIQARLNTIAPRL